MTNRLTWVWTAALCAGLAAFPVRVHALDSLTLAVPSGNDDLAERLRNASLLVSQQRDGITAADVLLAAARADYARMVGALYAAGRFGGTVSITLDGREAADIAPLAAPDRVDNIVITVRPGPTYRFSQARIAPLAFETELPDGFRTGAVAETGVIRDAAEAAITRWREVGHAKVDVASETIIADHATDTIATDIALTPGPRLRFGQLGVRGNKDVTERRLRKIAGLPTGEVYSPATVERVATRVRRTGAFRSVTLTEAETASADGTLDFVLSVAEQTPRRFGVGAELATEEGLTLTAFWLHRNFRGGAERLRFDAEIAGIGGDTGGIDYSLGGRIERPATFGPDIDAALYAKLEQFNEPEFTSRSVSIGLDLTRRVRDDLTNGGGIRLNVSEITDASGDETYTQLFFPIFATLDRRENPLNTDDGYYVDAEIAPFLGYSGSENGTRMTLDARAYEDFGATGTFVLAGRVQA
ncbi:MAG: outer membrane protein assembly factor, partial [Alphaproteobacteria bacterium]|nr:outer membrane protein assembly factor [Alphaproteobacteria bacterium]